MRMLLLKLVKLLLIVGEIIADRLLNPDDSLIESQCKERVLTLCNRFPLYEGKLEASIK